MTLLTLPNLLSLSRVVLAGIIGWALWRDMWVLSLVGFGVAIFTDLIDGRLARARDAVRPYGTLLDHGCDAFFVTLVAAVGAALGLIPVWLPISMASAFVQYALDVKAPLTGGVRASRLGRLNGVAYFVLVGMLLGVRHLWPAGAQWLLFSAWILTLSTLVSMIARAVFTWRVRR